MLSNNQSLSVFYLSDREALLYPQKYYANERKHQNYAKKSQKLWFFKVFEIF